MDSNYNTIKELISALSGTGENAIAVSRSFLEFMDSLEGGVFLSQLIFFSDKSKRTDGYFYKTYKEWKDHTYLSEHSVRKHTKKMVEMGVLETKVMKANGSPTLHYKFDIDKFIPLFVSFLKKQRNETENLQNGNLKNDGFNNENTQNGSREISDSITEITTEITTENTSEITTDNLKELVVVEEQESQGKVNPFEFYQRNGFGLMMNDITRQKITDWCNDLSDELVVYAMQISIERNCVSWSYAEGILKKWASKQVKSIDDVHALVAQFEAQRNQKAMRNVNRGRTENVPAWFAERKQEQAQPSQNVNIDFEAERQKVLEKLGRMQS